MAHKRIGSSGIRFSPTSVKKLGTDFQPALRDQLGETFLDSRYQLVQLLRVGSADPVPQLFTDAWNRLAPILKQAIPGATQSTASQYTSFIARWTRQALFPVRAAPGNFSHYAGCATERSWVVGAGGGDPLAYTAEIDADLRALLGFTGTLPDVHPSPLSGARPIGALVRQSIGALRRLPSALRTRQMPTSTD